MPNIKKHISILAIIPLTFGSLMQADTNPILLPLQSTQDIIAEKEMSLDNRYSNKFVNDIFKDNILLNLAYLRGQVNSIKEIKWEEITRPFTYEFKLDPNKTFAFHGDIQSKFNDSLVQTTNAHFNGAEGFKTDGYLFGDGVCHLASLINWVAKEANLEVEAPTNHNFANIPDVPKEFGVSIYSNPYSKGSNTMQNLYITNNRSKPVTFKFEYKDNKVKVSVAELK